MISRASPPVSLGGTLEPPDDLCAAVALSDHSIAGGVGRKLVRIDRVEDLHNIYADIQNELRSQYVLGFYPPDGVKVGSKWREVTVKVSEGTAKTIHGYYP